MGNLKFWNTTVHDKPVALNLGAAIWTSADVMTFFALHLILDGNLDICGHDDLFFALHLVLDGSLDICGRDDFFLLFT